MRAVDPLLMPVCLLTQGLEESVLRGAVDTLLSHRPFLFYEDSMLPVAQRKGVLLQQILKNRVGYVCECRNDCFCTPSGPPTPWG